MKIRLALIPAAALVLAGLSGCVVSAGSGMTAVGARDELYKILDHTQAKLGGDWQNQDDPTSRGCVFPVWSKGSHYPALRLGSAPTDARLAVKSVRTLWDKLGYSLQKSMVGDVTQLQGKSALGQLLVLRIGPDSMTLQGESECRPVQGR
jgi:hypothetical protein